ncbi:hypothetical protein E2C01_101943 [Portunus trituberculatus]|uniref:Uncharacterized protein n=1 Tax=Portunus trituberculatus TaxID=210409 RepID=A0A5B7K6V0_PORTR|nr:hypothetical protein [Portunus trituberculatus]
MCTYSTGPGVHGLVQAGPPPAQRDKEKEPEAANRQLLLGAVRTKDCSGPTAQRRQVKRILPLLLIPYLKK